MALVERGRGALAAQVAAYLGERVRGLAREQVDALVERVTDDIIYGGREAAEAIRQSIVQVGHESGRLTGDIVRGGAREIQAFANELAQSGRTWLEHLQEGGADINANDPTLQEIALANAGNPDLQGPVIDRVPNEVAVDENGFINEFDGAEELPDLGDLDPMDGNTEAPEASAPLAARAGGGGGPQSVSKETPISQYPSLSYGLQETHTTILPWTGWITATKTGSATDWLPNQLKVRMNTPYDMLDVAIAADPGNGVALAGNLFYGVPADSAANQSAGRYPERFTSASTEATEKPGWRDYWACLYDYYTVLGCEYEIEMLCPLAAGTSTAGLKVGVQFDTYSDTAGSTGNVMPKTKYSEVIAFKNIKWHTFGAGQTLTNNHISNRLTIRGSYKPGQAKRNIVNDGDVKTWTATSATLPVLKEYLTVNFWVDPLLGSASGTFITPVNMQISLKYIVQFKDLKEQARYPNSLNTGIDITQLLNETNTNNGALQRWA